MKKFRRRALRVLNVLVVGFLLVIIWAMLAVGGLRVPGYATPRAFVKRVAPGFEQAPIEDDAPPGQWQGFTPTAEQLNAAVDVLTRCDYNPCSSTRRFFGPEVTFRLDLTGYPASYLAEARAVFVWIGSQTGLTVIETTGRADIVVVPKRGNGALANAFALRGLISWSRVQLGCCRPRAAWEDLSQAFGPIGDKAGPYSVFTNDQTLLRPSDFDAWVLHWLYQMPPGSDRATVRATLRAAAGKR